MMSSQLIAKGHAEGGPSRAEVPRPSSSSITSERAPHSAASTATSSISYSGPIDYEQMNEEQSTTTSSISCAKEERPSEGTSYEAVRKK